MSAIPSRCIEKIGNSVTLKLLYLIMIKTFKKIKNGSGWPKEDKDVFVINSNYPRHCIRKRIINGNLIKYKCDICGIDPVWNNKPMPLILDHIDGYNKNNILSNLRFVCSNCDSQLSTYKSKNKNKNKIKKLRNWRMPG
jgi:hypothetical protein